MVVVVVKRIHEIRGEVFLLVAFPCWWLFCSSPFFRIDIHPLLRTRVDIWE